MSARSILYLSLVFVALLFAAELRAQDAPRGARTIESMINADGSLDLSTGYNGALDLSGWRMEIDPSGEPRFVRDSEKGERSELHHIPGDEHWAEGFGPPGIDGPVYALLVHGTDVYIGGDFMLTGRSAASNVAVWHDATSTWGLLGDDLINGVGGPVRALALQGDYLYVGGTFETAGLVRANGIAQWHLTRRTWSALGGGIVDTRDYYTYGGHVHAIATDEHSVYVGGLFLLAGGDTVNNMARWDIDAQSWSAICRVDANATNGPVYALALHEGNLYVGGGFTRVADISANRIARWDLADNTWFPLATGVNGIVRALAFQGDDLYVGGSFTQAGGAPANRLARWDGAAWRQVGATFDGDIYRLTASGGNLYVGGNFRTIGTTTVNGIARWNGSAWLPLGTGVSDTALPTVHAIVLVGNDIYAGGRFSAAGVSTALNIARWDTTAWRALTDAPVANLNGTNGAVFAVAVSGDYLYAGGDFTMAGGEPALRVARWNRRTGEWSPLGTGIGGASAFVRAMTVGASGDLYVGGIFSEAGGSPAVGIARWDGTRWSSVGGGVGGANPYVFALTTSGSTLYAAGAFDSAGTVRAPKIAKWDGTQWSALGSGIVGEATYTYASAVAATGSTVYVGGIFTRIGALQTNYIAKWDGTAWSALGTGVNAAVNALALDGTTLYVGGDFTQAGGAPASRVARWNGTAWSALGTTLLDAVTVLEVHDRVVYAGGEFIAGPGNTLNHIARWHLDSNRWEGMGRGTNGSVHAIAAIDREIYAGGTFTVADFVRANNVAQWTTSWSSMGSDPAIGIQNVVHAIAVKGSDVYVGGRFRTSGGVRTSGIARWDGRRWSAVGGGVGGADVVVRAITVAADGSLYVGGHFATAGGDSARNIARWDGTRWSAIGTGIGSGLATDHVYSIVVSGNDLYVGGRFVRAGDSAANNIAHWDAAASRWRPLKTGLTVSGNGENAWVMALGLVGRDLYVGGRFNTAGGSPALDYAIYRTSTSAWESMGNVFATLPQFDDALGAYAIAIRGSEVFVAGRYQTLFQDGSPDTNRCYVARWRNGVWELLGATNGIVAALHFGSDGNLYAGGRFLIIGEAGSMGTARWDGTKWYGLGSGVLNRTPASSRLQVGFVYAMGSIGDDLYVGGDFIIAGRKPAFYFSRWNGTVSDIDEPFAPAATVHTMLGVNRPNPFATTTTFMVTMREPGSVRLSLHSRLGEEVAEVMAGSLDAGEHAIRWDAPLSLPAGVYFYRIESRGRVETRKLVIVR